MTTPIKSEGFTIRLVLPASTCMNKVSKKILHALPKGSNLMISPRDYSLQKDPMYGDADFNNFHEGDKP